MTDPEAPAETPHLPTPDDRIPAAVWVLVAAGFTIAVGFGLIVPVLPKFAQSFGVGAFWSSVVVSAFAFFRLVFAPGGGRLVGRFGERPVYLTGLLIVAASSAATAYAHSYGQLLLYRSVGGIGSTMFTVSAVALLVRLAPPAIRAKVSSAYASSFLLGGIAGPAIGGALGGLGMHVPFLAYAAFLVLAAALVWAFIPAHLGARPVGPSTRPVLSVREALRDTAYRASLGSSFANGWSNFGVRNAIIPLFAAYVGGSAPWVAGLVLAVYAVGNALGIAAAGRLSDRHGRRPFIIGGLVVSGVATLVTGLVGNLPLLVLTSLVGGFGSGVLNPAQQASIADVVGRDRDGARPLSRVQMAADTGSILGPISAGLLVDHGSYVLAFAVTGVVLLLSALGWVRARETLPVSPLPTRP